MATITLIKTPDVTDLAGEKAMIDFDSGNYFLLKGAANDIWDMLRDGITTDEIVGRLTELYAVEPEACHASTVRFLESLEKAGFIRLVDG